MANKTKSGIGAALALRLAVTPQWNPASFRTTMRLEMAVLSMLTIPVRDAAAGAEQ